MRTVKEPEVRRNEILDAAGALFIQKGFDDTSTNEILIKAGIARGTLYYYFKSKEEIMDALIERQTLKLFTAAKAIAADKSIPLIERMVQMILALHVDDEGGDEMIAHMHKPQNALMHQKIQKSLVKEITPVMADIIREGIEQGLFNTPYPYECMEMVIIYAGTAFDGNDVVPMTPEQEASHIQAFLFNIERMLGVESGSLSSQLIEIYKQGGQSCTKE